MERGTIKQITSWQVEDGNQM